MHKNKAQDPFWLAGSTFSSAAQDVRADIAYEKRLEEGDVPKKPELMGCGTCAKCLQAAENDAAEQRDRKKSKRSYMTSSSGPR